MIKCLPEDEYGKRYNDEDIAEWEKQLKNGRKGKRSCMDSFIFKKKPRIQSDIAIGQDNEDVIDIGDIVTNKEKIAERFAEDNNVADQISTTESTLKAVDVHFTSKDPSI